MKHGIQKIGGRLVHFDRWLQTRTLFRALRAALGIAYPIILIVSYFDLIYATCLTQNGFLNQIYRISEWLPLWTTWQNLFNLVQITVNGLIAVVIAFTTANFMAREHRRDDLLAGILSAFAFLILNFNFAGVKSDAQGSVRSSPVSYFVYSNLGAQGIFLAIACGFTVGYIVSRFSRGSHTHMETETASHLLRRTHNIIRPFVIVIILATGISYGISLVSPQGLTAVIYNWVAQLFSNPGHQLLNILGTSALNNLLWTVGIIGPIAISGNSSIESIQNLEAALRKGSTWNLPNPISFHTLSDAYANFGGAGMTLGLIIAILLVSTNHNFRSIGKQSLLPGIFNLNEPILFGLPILFNPILLIPFILSPLAGICLAWVGIKLQLMPPVAYPLPKTTPGILIGFMGTDGNWVAFLFSLLDLIISVLIYIPFVKLCNRAETDIDIYEGVQNMVERQRKE
ncbi:PTS transporter subunit EIIC [Levilactobacillus bambusae]|uniref:Permease IIC component n=1 Tax=Levilactobacillus bambusae TaxID=2024736 RepID=A0A2V1N1A7_9LACO|nr:PTS transporter subunit EIIC [Levilactobacillus bambusae]PWG00175.1 PTS sugar transporter subunit IIC [Levilactobacillus bambusae]